MSTTEQPPEAEPNTPEPVEPEPDASPQTTPPVAPLPDPEDEPGDEGGD